MPRIIAKAILTIRSSAILPISFCAILPIFSAQMYIFYHTYASYCAITCVTMFKIYNLRRLSHTRLRNIHGEISAHDLLNENTGFSRKYDATSLTNTYNNTLGRYAMLSVKYRFATKKK